MNALRLVARGIDAGAAGTVVMDTLLYCRYRDGGGITGFLAWESSEGVDGWDTAPAPARAAKLLLEHLLKRELPARYARSLNNVTHWGFGLAMGGVYGLISCSRKPRVWYGLPFGAAVWASGYVLLPPLGVYEPIWKYDARTLENDLKAHLVFGAATAVAFSLLTKEDTND